MDVTNFTFPPPWSTAVELDHLHCWDFSKHFSTPPASPTSPFSGYNKDEARFTHPRIYFFFSDLPLTFLDFPISTSFALLCGPACLSLNPKPLPCWSPVRGCFHSKSNSHPPSSCPQVRRTCPQKSWFADIDLLSTAGLVSAVSYLPRPALASGCSGLRAVELACSALTSLRTLHGPCLDDELVGWGPVDLSIELRGLEHRVMAAQLEQGLAN